MGQVLYRKYRSRTLDEVVGQDHIVRVLKTAIKTKRLSHAYLFTGPRGVGKTSVARILAREVNSLPYQGEDTHLDIIEIDGASNRRIDEIRELRERANTSPTSADYKVYIIDEVHMLTKEAFNALLKTLEEPPAHCIFILATTESHKLPDTIISRTQRFSFKPIDKKSTVDHLTKIAKQEKINIDRAALELLAEHGGGSFRDAISLLDQLVGSKQSITAQEVEELLGLPSHELVARLAVAVETGNTQTVLAQLETAKDQAVNPAALAAGLSQALRRSFIDGGGESWMSDLLRALLEAPISASPYDYLEISLLEAASRRSEVSQPEPARPVSAPNRSQITQSTKESRQPTEPIQLSTKAGSNQPGFDMARWPELVELVKQEAASLYTALRLAEPSLSGDRLTLKFQFPLHQKKIAKAEATNLIGGLIEENFGAKLQIECLLDKSLTARQPVAPKVVVANDTADLDDISNIFGGGELLESREEV